MREEWHCYASPLRIYRQDYKLLLKYFNKIYPTKDAFDGTPKEAFDACFDNWISREYREKVIFETEKDMDNFPEVEEIFFQNFPKWLKEALKYTEIIVAGGNL